MPHLEGYGHIEFVVIDLFCVFCILFNLRFSIIVLIFDSAHATDGPEE